MRQGGIVGVFLKVKKRYSKLSRLMQISTRSISKNILSQIVWTLGIWRLKNIMGEILRNLPEMNLTQNNNMEYKITMAEVCELAHKYTEQECKKNNIQLEVIFGEGEIDYTKEAQAIFDKHYKLITETLGV